MSVTLRAEPAVVPSPPFWVAGAGAEDIVECLTATSNTSWVTGMHSGPGVLVFDRVVDALPAVSEASSLCHGRVIAVASHLGALQAGAGWDVLAAGAGDVIAWDGPVTARHLLQRLERWRQVDALVDSAVVRNRLVGHGRAWRGVLRQVVEAARFMTGPILVTGETGTGKELVARLVHDLDPRPGKGNLVIADCTTVVPALSGSEFFGHERGAFTDAVSRREGSFALADLGTLLLDEVGELPLSLQAELLRVIQEGTYKRVGSNVWQHTRFRLVCATNRDLVSDQDDGKFRSDLYHRIAAVEVHLPPLRERQDDVEMLFGHFLQEFTGSTVAFDLDPLVRDLLLQKTFPGNVRDLRQFARRVAHRHLGAGPITVGDIPEADRPGFHGAPGSGIARHEMSQSGRVGDQGGENDALDAVVVQMLARGFGLKELRDAIADAAVRAATAEAGGALREAANRLGVTVRALQLRRAGHRDAVGSTSDGAAPASSRVA